MSGVNGKLWEVIGSYGKLCRKAMEAIGSYYGLWRKLFSQGICLMKIMLKINLM